jgi:hypothetical protein
MVSNLAPGDWVLIEQDSIVGLRPSFRPMYAPRHAGAGWANMGDPSDFLRIRGDGRWGALWVEVCALSALCALWVEVCALSALCALWVEVCALSALCALRVRYTVSLPRKIH